LDLPDGGIWRNIVTEEKSAVAHSLEQFRGNYKYNLLDGNLRAFNAQVPMLAQWPRSHQRLVAGRVRR
jgi:alkaline phosphatase D